MFNKLKQFKELRHQAKKVQNQMNEERFSMSKDGITLTINGANEILELDIDNSLLLDKAKLINAIKKVFKEAVHNMQKKMAKKMIGSDINFDALKKLGM